MKAFSTISTAGGIIIPLSVVAILFGGCNAMVAPDETNVLMPLAIGNRWIGEMTTYEGATATTVADTLEIVSEKNIDGETWFVANDGNLFINRSDGLHIMESFRSECESFTGKYPSRAGDSTIIGESFVLLPDSDQPVMSVVVNRVVTTDTSITTAAGTYPTFHYRTEVALPANARLITPQSRFYKPNLGPVRIEHGGERLVWRWDLVRAELR